MQPTDGERRSRALSALMALDDDLECALKRPSPNRAHSRQIGSEMREILAKAEKVLGGEHSESIRAFVERARDKTLRTLGASGWDQPESREVVAGDVPAGLAAATVPSLTDDELLDLEIWIKNLRDLEPVHKHDAQGVSNALSELRRLRADAAALRRAGVLVVGICSPPENEAHRKIWNEAVAVLCGCSSQTGHGSDQE